MSFYAADVCTHAPLLSLPFSLDKNVLTRAWCRTHRTHQSLGPFAANLYGRLWVHHRDTQKTTQLVHYSKTSILRNQWRSKILGLFFSRPAPDVRNGRWKFFLLASQAHGASLCSQESRHALGHQSKISSDSSSSFSPAASRDELATVSRSSQISSSFSSLASITPSSCSDRLRPVF